MTVTELRELLAEFEAAGKGDMPVKFEYNYGDHWRTHVAQDANMCEEASVTYSDYHRMDKVVDSNDYEEDFHSTTKNRKVILIG